jgi:hypothetical protein
VTLLSARLAAASDRLAELAVAGVTDVLDPAGVAALQFLLKELGNEAAFHEDSDPDYPHDAYCDDELLAGQLADVITNGGTGP